MSTSNERWTGGASTTSGWLTQRRAVLALLGVEVVVSVIGLAYYLATLVFGSAARPVAMLFVLTAPVMIAIFVLYWRGWEPARYVATLVNMMAAGLSAPIPGDLTYLPHTIIIPSATALILANPAWVVGSAVGMVVVLVVRHGGVPPYLGPLSLLGGSITIACLVVSRLVIEAARREAEGRAEQAERDRREIEKHAELLSATEAWNRALLDAIPDSLYRLTRDGLVLERRAPDDGRVRLHQQYEGRILDDLLDPEIGQRLRDAIAETLATGRPSVVEYEWHASSEGPRLAHSCWHPAGRPASRSRRRIATPSMGCWPSRTEWTTFAAP